VLLAIPRIHEVSEILDSPPKEWDSGSERKKMVNRFVQSSSQSWKALIRASRSRSELGAKIFEI
jgi:hypothetical protein